MLAYIGKRYRVTTGVKCFEVANTEPHVHRRPSLAFTGTLPEAGTPYSSWVLAVGCNPYARAKQFATIGDYAFYAARGC
jgi:hypothetical protein